MNRTLEHAKRAVRLIALRNSISEAEVIAEIEGAMAEMRQNAYANEDQEKIKIWESIPHAGENVTALEMIAYYSQKLNDVQ